MEICKGVEKGFKYPWLEFDKKQLKKIYYSPIAIKLKTKGHILSLGSKYIGLCQIILF